MTKSIEIANKLLVLLEKENLSNEEYQEVFQHFEVVAGVKNLVTKTNEEMRNSHLVS